MGIKECLWSWGSLKLIGGVPGTEDAQYGVSSERKEVEKKNQKREGEEKERKEKKRGERKKRKERTDLVCFSRFLLRLSLPSMFAASF